MATEPVADLKSSPGSGYRFDQLEGGPGYTGGSVSLVDGVDTEMYRLDDLARYAGKFRQALVDAGLSPEAAEGLAFQYVKQALSGAR